MKTQTDKVVGGGLASPPQRDQSEINRVQARARELERLY